jgi:hypothetical protein
VLIVGEVFLFFVECLPILVIISFFQSDYLKGVKVAELTFVYFVSKILKI